MDLKQLKILRAIAETGSFHGAADKLHLTQPAVSHHLKNLEEELGETLVLRSRPRAVLLPAGECVLAAAERIDAELERLKLRFSSKGSDAPVGLLRVAASTLGIVYLYGDLLEAFITKHPRSELAVTVAESGISGARHVLNGTCDVAFAPFPVDLPMLETMHLSDAEHVVIVSRSHPLAGRRRVSVKDLRAYPFIRYQPDAGSRVVSDRVFLGNGGFPTICLESNDTEFIKRVVALGTGTAIVPKFTVTQMARDDRLAVLQIDGVSMVQGFGLVYRRGTRMRALELFQQFCDEHRSTIGQCASDAATFSLPERGTPRYAPSTRGSCARTLDSPAATTVP